jgi:hypothetical protein
MTQPVQAYDRVRDQAERHARELSGFDYGAAAELFPSRNKKGKTHARYRRFDTAAEAVRFAVEELPPPALLGAYLVIDDERFGAEQIQYLYENAAYPLQRGSAKKGC